MREGEPGKDIHEECRRQIAAIEARMEKLEQENQKIRAQLKQNSQNSSRPPSSDPAWAPPRSQKPKTGRKRGGQPGHKGHRRKLLPPDQVNQVVVVKPSCCAKCGKRLSGIDENPFRHQIIEVPPNAAEVTEIQLHELECGRCHHSTQADLPEGVSESCFGPKLEAMIAYLSGKSHLSKRQIQDVLMDLWGIEISLGAISTVEKRVSRALEAPYEEARDYVQKQVVKHADETGFRQESNKAWVWIAVTMGVTLLMIRLRRNAESARALLGDFSGYLVTDRWNAYNGWPVRWRQLCWAHLIRDFKGFLDRGKGSAKIGKALLVEVDQMFALWHRIRDGTLKRSTFRTYMGPIRRRIEALLKQGVGGREKKTAGMCREILKLAPALWTFVRVKGIEPTNNVGEREIRQMVLYRKISYGTQSVEGSRFVERIMTAVLTLRQQRRNVIEYLTQACQAARAGRAAPSLLPTKAQRVVA